MTTLTLLISLALPLQGVKNSAPVDPLTEDDRKVIDCVVSDLASYKGKDFELAWFEGNRYLNLIDETRGRANADWAVQLEAELDKKRDLQVTTDIREDWIRRNRESHGLAAYRPTSPKVVMASVEKRRMPIREIMGDSAASMGWVQVAMPGYSKDRSKAILRFWFGPTPHGAAGTYLVERRKGSWVVLWRDFAHYL